MSVKLNIFQRPHSAAAERSFPLWHNAITDLFENFSLSAEQKRKLHKLYAVQVDEVPNFDWIFFLN